MALRVGDAVPHFEATTVDGRRVRYRDIWQRQPLVVISAPADESGRRYAQLAATREPDVSAHDARLVITHDLIPGLPQPGALVADQWGELAFVADDLVPPDELIAWLRHVRQKCPECEGESR
jgi:hypothetical protein